MSTARRIALVVGLIVTALGIWVVADWLKAKTIWPESIVAIEMPPPMFPPDAEADPALQALLETVASFEGEPLDLLLDAEGPPETPAEGWPVVPEETAARFDAFLATTGWTVEPTAPDAPGPDYFGLLTVNDIRLMRSMVRFVEGDRGGAWEDLVTAHTYAQRVQHAGGNLLLPMVGLAIEGETMHIAERLLAADGWAPEAKAFGASLSAAAGRRSPLVAGLTGEALGFDGLYARMGEASLEELMQTTEGGPPASLSGGGTIFFDAEKTRALHHQYFSELIAAAAAPRAERVEPSMPELWSDKWYEVGQFVDNPVGRILLSIGAPAFNKYIERYDRYDAQRARLAIRLAKSAWRAERGEEASSIDALVPDYLPAVPIDALSGEALTLDPPPLPEDDRL